MKKTTKVIVIGAGALMAAGAAGVAIAERGDGMGYRGHGFHGGDMQQRHGGGRFGRFFSREMTKDDFDKRARQRFAGIDTNSDGVLDEAEIKASIENRLNKRRGSWGQRGKRGEGPGQGRRRGMMARLDADGDGKVTRAEFEAGVKDRFARFDLNNDGAITDDDLPPRMRGKDVLKGDGPMIGRGGMGRRHHRPGGRMMGKIMRLRQADANNDGSISLDEAMAFANKRFARKDQNGDGVVDQADRDLRKQANIDYRVKRFIHRFGKDADAAGKVTREQFMARAGEKFAKLDVNKDGTITRDERGRGHWRRGGRGGRDHGGRGLHGGRHHRGSGE